jgi:hypothetical protein
MPATTTVRFNPARLNAQIAAGFRKSIGVAALDAKANSPSPVKAGAKAIVAGSSGAIVGTGPLAGVFEKGARQHTIGPVKKKALFGGYGHPVSVPVLHPGSRAKPYLGPAAGRWARGGAQLTMRAQLLSGGFR